MVIVVSVDGRISQDTKAQSGLQQFRFAIFQRRRVLSNRSLSLLFRGPGPCGDPCLASPPARLFPYTTRRRPQHFRRLSDTHSNTMAKTNQAQIQRAIEQMTDRGPIPEIDFTVHTLEDGAVVSTQERVIKDVRGIS
jgi:hypothetical protein